ncbi:hypothetical protein [Rubinisphaera italica]|uniref:DUF1559 domain-containing protein n=1 Tax=Rubinisphaera italica TaxID=2527969 RepID=A0A5C5XKX5_9PLAN|nr:hypothetical protein [Rubinisphaera italica]TWT63358.1 hypothetical protein Pan54_41110 [Rubinisphaera italica]
MAIVAGEFLCPNCAARLRIHQSGQKQTEIDCPECAAHLLVEMTADNRISVIPRPEFDGTVPVASLHRFPISVAIVLMLITCTALFFLVDFDSNEQKSSEENPEIANQNPSVADPELTSNAVGPVAPAVPEKISFEDRLQKLGIRINEYRLNTGQFLVAGWKPNHEPGKPTGLSWLAGLDPELEAGSKYSPNWNVDWHSPVNDRFVRRSRSDLQNPELKTVVGSDRYPATHIVGISGVGDDAAELPKDDPRAGIFGWNRVTRTEDVKDGLSNTWLASGITERFSSWANASQSIRPVTSEPYINGPDGFGMGSSERMPILMADGSVRAMNDKTAPTIFRRLAAMADGLPLDSKIAGEPGKTESTQADLLTNKPIMPEVVPSEQTTSSPPIPPETVSPEVQQAMLEKLNQKVLSFELNQPTALNEVLVELEALAGVTIDFDEQQIAQSDPVRTHLVILSGKGLSISEMLDQILTPQNLILTPANGRLLIRRAKNE